MDVGALKFEYFKSSGPGGQHKNKRFTAVRVTDVSSGLSAVGQKERSQAANKELALRRLCERLRQRTLKKKKRVPTRASSAAKQRTRVWKKQHGLKKQMRQERFDREE